MHVDLETGEVVDGQARPALTERNGRVNWSAFWAEAKRLGFDQRSVHEIAGTDSLAHLDQAAIEDLLGVLRDRAEQAAAVDAEVAP